MTDEQLRRTLNRLRSQFNDQVWPSLRRHSAFAGPSRSRRLKRYRARKRASKLQRVSR